MDYAAILRKGAPLARKAYGYVLDDVGHHYGLASPAWAEFSGDGIGVLGRSLEVGSVTAGPLTVVFRDAGHVRLESAPFAPEDRHWNGPNVIPDALGDGSLEMSLWHDLGWKFAEMIATALGCTVQEVMRWFDGILAAAYRGYGERRGRKSGWRAWVAYNVCERSRRWWKRVFPGAVSLVLAAVLLAGCSGCVSPPDWDLDDSNLGEVLDGGR